MLMQYLSVFVFLLVAVVGAILQMNSALEEADIEKFILWTGIASVIASLPISL